MLTAENTSKTVVANGVLIQYHEAGPESNNAPNLICVAATAFGATAWGQNRKNIEPLSRKCRIFLINLPPHGGSDKKIKSDSPRTIFYANLLRDFMDALGIKNAHMYGGSPGAGPVLRFATLFPERVLRLVVDAPTGLGKSMFSPMPVEGAKLTRAFGDNPTYENALEVMKVQISVPELREEAALLRYEAAMAPGYQDARFNIGGPPENLLDFIGNVSTPTLIIWGTGDRDVPMDRALAAMWEMPNARVHLFGADCGHWPQYERAEEWNQLVIGFLGLEEP